MDLQQTEASSIFKIKPGSIIAGRYEVTAQIAAGGMGIVFRCIDHVLNDDAVALKLLNPYLAQDEKVFQRFLNEVLVARSLSHPNIVRIHDIGRSEDGYPYISMEYLSGRSLRDRLDYLREEYDARRRIMPAMDFGEAVHALLEILKGAAVAHQKGIIHRDFKPGNVLMSAEGEIKIVDFGTARIVGGTSGITQDGSMMGTPDYMSPEQIAGEPLDVSCDIYALGIMGYEFVMGETPFQGENLVAIAFKHVNEAIPHFADPDHGIPQWYEDVIVRATAKSKYDRFASAEEFALALIEQTAFPQGDVRAAGLSYSSGSWPAMTNAATASQATLAAVEPRLKAATSVEPKPLGAPQVTVSENRGWMWASIASVLIVIAAGVVFNGVPSRNELALQGEKTREQLEQELKQSIKPGIESTTEKVEPPAVVVTQPPVEEPKQTPVVVAPPITPTVTPTKKVVEKPKPKVEETPALMGPVSRYSGTFNPTGGAVRSVSFVLSEAGDSISGYAEVESFGKLSISGANGARGLVLTLDGAKANIRLTGSKRGSILRGRYAITTTGEEGSWQVSLN